MQKSPSHADAHVGSRIRMRRTLIGMSQEKLGEALGVTFQQVQKYEKGSNRVGAGRLQNIGTVLGVPVSYFYEGLPGNQSEEGSAENAMMSVLSTADGVRLIRAFVAANDSKLQRKIVELVETVLQVHEIAASTSQ